MSFARIKKPPKDERFMKSRKGQRIFSKVQDSLQLPKSVSVSL